MKGYIICSIGNNRSEDYICVTGFDDNIRKVFFSKEKATKFCKKLQKQYDLDDPDNIYEFQVKEVEIITDI